MHSDWMCYDFCMINYLFYFGLQIRRVMNYISKKLLKAKFLDDFDWNNYTSRDYGPQLEEMRKVNNVLLPSNLEFIENLANFRLNPQIEQLYRRVMELSPKDLLEVGSGAGSNLINLQLLLPTARVAGVELLSSQVDLGKEIFGVRFPQKEIVVADFIKEDVKYLGDYEMVFTNAVAMHLTSRKVKALILKMLSHSRQYVLLHENLMHSHNFLEILLDLNEYAEFKFTIEKPSNSAFGFVIIVKD